jgi:MFS family permease
MRLWIGQTISLFGGALTGLALPVIAAATLNATPLEMGILAAVGSLPSLLIGLLAGVWVDRYRRRTFMIAGDVGRAVLIVTIPLAAVLGLLSMAQLYVVGFLVGVLNVFFDVASNSYLPALLDAPQLVEGNGKLALSRSITAVAGPSLAGLIIQAITAPFAIVLDALSYLASAICIGAIRHREEPSQAEPAPALTQARAGLKIVFGSRYLRALAGCMATSNLMSSMFFALYVLFGTRVLGLDAAQLGLVYGLGASGAMLGALLGPWAVARLGIGRAMVTGAFLGSLEIVPVIFATPESAVALLLLSSLAGNFGWTLYNINEASLRQVVTPSAFRGRMNATFTFIGSGMLPLGGLLGGILGQALGPRETIILAACGSVGAFVWVLLSPVRGLVRLQDAVI